MLLPAVCGSVCLASPFYNIINYLISDCTGSFSFICVCECILPYTIIYIQHTHGSTYHMDADVWIV